MKYSHSEYLSNPSKKNLPPNPIKSQEQRGIPNYTTFSNKSVNDSPNYMNVKPPKYPPLPKMQEFRSTNDYEENYRNTEHFDFNNMYTHPNPNSYQVPIGVPMMPLYGYDNMEDSDKDWVYMRQMYPLVAKKILPEIEEECDKLEYDGSSMYDEYPDQVYLSRIVDQIYSRIRYLEMEQVTASSLESKYTPPYKGNYSCRENYVQIKQYPPNPHHNNDYNHHDDHHDNHNNDHHDNHNNNHHDNHNNNHHDNHNNNHHDNHNNNHHDNHNNNHHDNSHNNHNNDKNPPQNCGCNQNTNWLRSLIEVMLFNEIMNRRRHYRGRKRWF